MQFSRAVDLLIAAGEEGDAGGGKVKACRGQKGVDEGSQVAARPWWEVADYMDVLDSHKASLCDAGVSAEEGMKNRREAVEHGGDEEEDVEGAEEEGDEEEESWAGEYLPEHLGEGIQGKYSLALVCTPSTATAATNSSSWRIPVTTATSYC
jgi:hypothetical protein